MIKMIFWIDLKAMKISFDQKELLVSMLQWIGPLPKYTGSQPSPEISRNDTNKRSHETSSNCVGSSWRLPGDDIWLLSRFWSFLVLKSIGQGSRTHHWNQSRLSMDDLCALIQLFPWHTSGPQASSSLSVLSQCLVEFVGLPSGVTYYWKP